MSDVKNHPPTLLMLTPPPFKINTNEPTFIGPASTYTTEEDWSNNAAFVNTSCCWCGLTCAGDTLKSKYPLSLPTSISENDDGIKITMDNKKSFNSFACLISYIYDINKEPEQSTTYIVNMLYQQWNPDAAALDMIRCRAPSRIVRKEYSGSSGKGDEEYIEELCA